LIYINDITSSPLQDLISPESDTVRMLVGRYRLPFHLRFLGVVVVLAYVALALWGMGYLLQPNTVATVVNPEN
jgi:hypothetical protein